MNSNNDLKQITREINEILNKLNDNLFSKIGNSGNLWTGDSALVAKSTFDNLTAKYKMYEEKLNNMEKRGE